MTILEKVAARVARRAEDGIVDPFLAAEATAKERAIAFTPDRPAQERHFARMLQFGAIVEIGRGAYYLDERALANFRKEALARVLGAVAVAGFAAAGALALGR